MNDTNVNIWYHLYGMDGQPFKGATPNRVTLPETAEVEDLRDAVKTIEADDLVGIGPSRLLIFENQDAAFHQPVVGEADRKKKTLANSLSIRNLRTTSEGSPLIVLVPELQVPEEAIQASFDTSVMYQREYDKYAAVAKLIVERNDDALLQILELAKQLPRSFIYVGGSSGTGKTQLAITLREYYSAPGANHRPVFYIPTKRQLSQDIYLFFDRISKGFMNCVDEDMKQLNPSSKGVHVLDVVSLSQAQVRLYTYGYFYHLLERDGDLSDTSLVQIKRRTVVEFQDLLRKKEMNANESLPLVILDEYQPIDVDDKSLLRFMRNAVIALNCKCIIMGTDSTAARMVILAQDSRASDAVWCTLVFKLPELVGEDDTMDPVWNDVRRHSRPWFAHLANEYVKKHGMHNEPIEKWFEPMAQEVGRKIVAAKEIRKKVGGRHGQIALFLSASFSPPQSEAHSAIMVHQHFAKFGSHTSSLGHIHLNNKLEVIGGDLSSPNWQPWNVLPSPADDLLLHLCLTGIPGVSSIFGSDEAETYFSKAVDELLNDVRRNQLILKFDNVDQVTNDGMKLEALTAATICIASHAEGFRGCSVKTFFTQFWYHLVGKIDENRWNFGKLSDIAVLESLKIPFMSPPNLPWPDLMEKLNAKGFAFDFLRRTINNERIDMLVESILSAECKDHKEAIHSGLMRSILDRIPPDTVLHIVVTNHLQKEPYFHRTKLKFGHHFTANHRASQAVYWRLNESGFEQNVKGLQNAEDPKLVVVFVERF